MYYNVDSINLNSSYDKNEVKSFLKKFELNYEDVDYSVVIRENNEIIATCSKKENVLKCFAIDENYQGLGLSNTLISKITEKLFLEKRYHSFIFTKPENQYLFEGLNYKNIFTTNKVSLLESGNKNINNALEKLKQEYNISSDKEYATIVMNCNPFTLGHRYLIERASEENENVIIFVVEEDKSVFPFNIRYKMVKKGIEDLRNVIVVPAGEYIISSATFPTYFFKQHDNTLKEYTKLDCNIFGQYFVPKFNIIKRYIGSEPGCEVTNIYNETINEVLPKYNVKVNVIERKEINDKPISASRVRKLLKDNNIEEVKKLVPKTTIEILNSEDGETVISKL